jgi:arylsulfatase A
MAGFFRIFFCLIFVFSSWNAETAHGKPPNILFILCDDLGVNDLHCYGRQDHHTPNLDRLAAEGMRFTSAYCAQPICSASRAAILTGKTPARLHLTSYLPGRADCIAQKVLHPEIQKHVPLTEKMLPKYFKQAGYISAAIGKWHVGGKGFEPLEHGFDVYHPGQPRTTPSEIEGGKGEYELTALAERFIETNQSRPFLIYLAHNAPHIPYDARKASVEKNSAAFEPIYAAMIETLDDSVGRLMKKLEDLKLVESTIVIFSSDNGGLHVPEGGHKKITHNTPYRAGKGFLYEGGLRIPLLVRWPGHVPSNKVSEIPVVNTDWVPTLLNMVGLPIPNDLDGMNLGPFLTGRGSVPSRKLFWHFPHYTNQGSRPSGAMREDSWMLIEFYDEERVELFNLETDIRQTRNVALQETERVQAMRRELAAWRTKVGAQQNKLNPNFESASFHTLYVQNDASQFDPLTASETQWEEMLRWRKDMNSVLARRGAKPGNQPSQTR